MVKTPSGYLRKPSVPGSVAPQVVLDVLATTESRSGTDARTDLADATSFGRLPGPTESVPQLRAHDLHKAVRDLFPDDATDILREAGKITADGLMLHQLSTRAQTMLSGGPWTISAWLLGRWARQNSWTFAGSAVFAATNALEFSLVDNPLIRGETANAPLCSYHEALFERLFQRLVDPNLVCREISCQAMGAPSCRFLVALG